MISHQLIADPRNDNSHNFFRRFEMLSDHRGGLAGEPGFEPGLSGSEPLVLPLNYSPTAVFRYSPTRAARGLAYDDGFENRACSGVSHQ